MLRRTFVGVIGSAVVLSACGKEASTDPVTIPITISKGKTDPSAGRVTVGKGAKVTVTVTSDAEDMVHVHGYDIEMDVKPGIVAQAEFTADKTGSYEIESHKSGTLIVTLDVR